MTEPIEGGHHRFSVRPTVQTHFSWVRTRFALERTLLAWMRTGASLIGFGFTLFQFLHNLNVNPDIRAPVMPYAPAAIGLAMIGAGTIALGISISQYLKIMKYLWHEQFETIAGFEPKTHFTPALFVSALLVLVGLFAFTVVLLSLE